MTSFSDSRASRADALRRRRAEVTGHTQVVFHERDGAHVGVGEDGRRWRISRCLTGWHLEFLDEGDRTHTNAGIHRTLQAAINEASR